MAAFLLNLKERLILYQVLLRAFIWYKTVQCNIIWSLNIIFTYLISHNQSYAKLNIFYIPIISQQTVLFPSFLFLFITFIIPHLPPTVKNFACTFLCRQMLLVFNQLCTYDLNR